MNQSPIELRTVRKGDFEHNCKTLHQGLFDSDLWFCMTCNAIRIKVTAFEDFVPATEDGDSGLIGAGL